MLREYEYAQKVMKVAGVNPAYWHLVGRDGLEFHHPKWSTKDECDQWRLANGHGDYTPKASYPNPLTSGDAFLALWDALEAKGYLVDFDSNRNHYGSQVETCATVWSLEERNEAFWSSQSSTDRKAALVEAAGQALGVSRD